MKKCNKCGEEKEETDFYKSNKSWCKECMKRRQIDYRNANKEAVAYRQKMRYEARKDVYSAKQKEYREKHRDEIAKRKKEKYDPIATSLKNKEYRLANPDKIKEMRRRYYLANKERCLTHSREWRLAHLEECKKRDREYYERHKDERWRKMKDYYIANRDAIRKQRTEYYQRNLQTMRDRAKMWRDGDVRRRIDASLRRRVRMAIGSGSGYSDLLGCDIEMVLEWFEYHFNLDSHMDMSWDNYGTHWHIEHVTPVSSFDVTNDDDVNRCFHWTNTRPLPAKLNMKKGGRISPMCQLQQELRVVLFMKYREESSAFELNADDEP